jgi:hypothetical protein
MFAAAYKWGKKAGTLGPIIINETRSKTLGGFTSSKCTRATKLYLLEKVQNRSQDACGRCAHRREHLGSNGSS